MKKTILLTLILLSLSGLTFAQQSEGQRQNNLNSTDLQLTSKPKPPFTDKARQKNLQGVVRLEVTFLANGEIGEIIDVTKKKRKKFIEYGLSANAIAAAKKIKFTPAMENGVPVTVTKIVEYSFTLY